MPDTYRCCGGTRMWGHKLNCPVRKRAIERRENAQRAARHSHETRRAGVETTPLHSGVGGGVEWEHWSRCKIPNCRRCDAYFADVDREYDLGSGA